MKKRLVNQKIMGPAIGIMVLLSAITNHLAGQVQLCENTGYTINATGTGCTKAEAKLAMRLNAAALAVAVCPDKVCQQDTVSPCALKAITAVTGTAYSTQNDNNCPQPHLRWTATRTYTVTCKCINVPQPQRNEVIVPDDPDWDGFLSLFPNPSVQQVFIDVSAFNGNVQLSVINMLGQRTMNEVLNLDGMTIYTLDISSFAPGIYKLILTEDFNFAVGTFVKESK